MIYNMFGKNNPRYKDGSSAGYIQRISREAVFNDSRNINICETCGKNKKPSWNMVIHHKDRNRKNNDASNLIVLCSHCHAKIHRNNRSEKKCLWCNKSYNGTALQKFCCVKCYYANYRNNNREFIRKNFRDWYKQNKVNKLGI